MHFIEFTTNPENPNTRFSMGSPVHDGKMPTEYDEIRGVRVDGELVQFKDNTLVQRLYETLLKRRPYVREGNFECTDFAGLMMQHPGMSPNGMMPYSLEQYGEPVDPNDDSVDEPLNLYTRSIFNTGSWKHIIVPSHTTEGSGYIHKLGAGSICLSGLEEALAMYSCHNAYVAKIQPQH